MTLDSFEKAMQGLCDVFTDHMLVEWRVDNSVECITYGDVTEANFSFYMGPYVIPIKVMCKAYMYMSITFDTLCFILTRTCYPRPTFEDVCEHLFKFAKESGIESVVLLGEDHSQLPMSYLMSFGFEPEQPYGYIAYMPESGQDNSGPALGGTGISKMNLQ